MNWNIVMHYGGFWYNLDQKKEIFLSIFLLYFTVYITSMMFIVILCTVCCRSCRKTFHHITRLSWRRINMKFICILIREFVCHFLFIYIYLIKRINVFTLYILLVNCVQKWKLIPLLLWKDKESFRIWCRDFIILVTDFQFQHFESWKVLCYGLRDVGKWQEDKPIKFSVLY